MAPRPTLRDVATAAGVHPATASRALNEATRSLVRPATVARVREVATALGYQVNPIARSLKTSRSETVGVLVPDLTNPLFPPIVRGIEDALADSGYTVLTANTDNDPARTSSNFAAMQARQVDGFIVATALLDDPFMHEAAARGVPMVLVNRQTEHLDVSAVAGDDATGSSAPSTTWSSSATATSRTSPARCSVSTGAVRLRAFRAAMHRHGLRDDRIVEAEAYSEAAGRTALLQLLGDDRPTAVVAGNDLLALGCYDALDEAGLSCPGDLSIVGFNDMPFISRLQPAADLGAGAAVRARRRGGPPAARPAQRPHGDAAGGPAAGAAGRPRVDRSPAGRADPGLSAPGAHDGRRVDAEVGEHHPGGVPPGPAGHRAAGMRGRAGLVDPLDRQPVRRPADQHLARRQPELPAVAGAADVVPVARLEVHRRLAAHGEHVLRPQPGHPLRRPLDDLRGEPVALGVPRARGEVPRGEGQQLRHPLPVGRAVGVDDGRADDEHPRVDARTSRRARRRRAGRTARPPSRCHRRPRRPAPCGCRRSGSRRWPGGRRTA